MDIDVVIRCLGDSEDCIRGLRDRNGYAPELGDQVMNDLRSLPGPTADPFATPALAAYGVAAAQVGAAEDHIYALQTLLLEGEVSVAPFTLARSAVEASGRAFILLDPALTARERASAWIAERLGELDALNKLMEAHDPTGSSPRQCRRVPAAEGCLMHAVLALTPLHDALAELELAVALVLLAEQEGQAIGDTLPRLRGALACVGEVRDLATELTAATGRPPLHVLDGGQASAQGTSDVA